MRRRHSPLCTRLLLAAAGVVLLAATACSTGADAVDQSAGGDFRFVASTKVGETIPVAKRKSAPAFSGQTLDGKRLSIRDYRGRVVAINFWASWCSPCRAEVPDIEQVYQLERHRGLQVLGIDVKDVKSQAQSFVRGKGMTYPSLWDPQSRVALAFRNLPPAQLPSTIVLDRRGRVAGVYIRPLLATDLQSIVDPLLAEK